MPVPSPCINVCTVDPATGLCRGCARTLQEISDWPRLDDAGMRAVWARIAQRKAVLTDASPSGSAPLQPPDLSPRR